MARTIRDYLEAAKKVRANLPKEVDRIIDANKDKIEDILKEQLMEGKNMFGRDIRPLYTEDPYFKSPESAKKYAEWKNRITPNPKRSIYAPNLFINGQFYSEIKLVRKGENSIFSANGILGQKIFSKYKDVFSLNPEKNGVFEKDILKPNIEKFIAKDL